jgi:hypothetical protein
MGGTASVGGAVGAEGVPCAAAATGFAAAAVPAISPASTGKTNDFMLTPLIADDATLATCELHAKSAVRGAPRPCCWNAFSIPLEGQKIAGQAINGRRATTLQLPSSVLRPPSSVLRHPFSEKGSGSPSGGDIRNTSRIMEIMT